MKKLKDDFTGAEEENFFLEDELQDARTGKGYEEINMDEDGRVADGMAEMETLDKIQRQNQDAERGYFLQPVYAQKIDHKIYLYDDLVHDMKREFRDRLDKKRKIINKMKHKCKELALKDATLLCDRCQQEVSLLKTVTYIADDTHHAKCVFGHLRRAEVHDCVKDAESYYSDQDNKDFIEMYLEIFKEMQREDALKNERQLPDMTCSGLKKAQVDAYCKPPLPKYAFCECRNHHLVGIVVDQKFYFTDVSQLRMMFPQGHYEDWSAQWWSPGYRDAFELQSKLNIKRAQESARHGYRNQPTAAEAVTCELCNKVCSDPDEFILHCSKDRNHLDLIQQFSDESYDIMFEQLDKRQVEVNAKKDDCKAVKD